MLYQYRVSSLLSYIGKSINMDYGCEGSSASTEDAVTLLQKMGYATEGVVDFFRPDAYESIRNGMPVMIYGYIKQDYQTGAVEDGHAWLLDGLIHEKRMEDEKYMYVKTYREEYHRV